ncbi:hypothetical protein JR316_0007961 [Psilocybe cubensis]|uniref:Uncharacterized protein n=1 Tax=Psilocybe cubensis TaxID=181762 RepID=A0ACB8GUX5_PSICU|nr:hypothetical protein JR316_0007961 [Psilocybe cubensis]KAH9479371.1 hypothetical protein JR316_0007961 [Psilocybe cubensis]
MFKGNLWSSILLVLGLVAVLVFSSPLEDPGTNAQRLARGLSPNPPKFLRDKVIARRATTPTPRLDARQGTPSVGPSVTITGRLQVRNPQDGNILGYVRNWSGGGTIAGINALGPEEDLIVKMTFHRSDPTQINILATVSSFPNLEINFDLGFEFVKNPAFPPPFYVGAGTFDAFTVPTLAAGSRETVPFTNVEKTPKGSPPKVPARQAFVESAIWTIDKKTHELHAQWINEDGSRPPTILAYDIRENQLFFVGDIAAYNLNNDLPASAVQLFIETLSH